jgi:hypothetical protein
MANFFHDSVLSTGLFDISRCFNVNDIHISIDDSVIRHRKGIEILDSMLKRMRLLFFIGKSMINLVYLSREVKNE